jgi:hypothetical protein
VMNDHFHYGRLVTETWQAGQGFILVEHDVVPWPGALAELEACAEECCAFEYPAGSSWCMSLGCIKFSTSLVASLPYGNEWQNRGWDELDGAVFATLQDAQVQVHIHHPPVAHAKARTLVMRAA